MPDQAPHSEESDVRKFTPKEKQLIEELFNIYMFLSIGAMPFSMTGSLLIGQQAQACSEAHILVARRHKSYMKFLQKLTTASAYGAMISAHMPIVMGVATELNLIKPLGLFNAALNTEGDKKDATERNTGSFFGRPSVA